MLCRSIKRWLPTPCPLQVLPLRLSSSPPLELRCSLAAVPLAKYGLSFLFVSSPMLTFSTQAKKTVNYAESSDEDDVVMPRKARQTRSRNRTRVPLDDDEAEDEYVGGNDYILDDADDGKSINEETLT